MTMIAPIRTSSLDLLEEASEAQERDDQIDALCAYLGIELVKTRDGRWKCIEEGKK